MTISQTIPNGASHPEISEPRDRVGATDAQPAEADLPVVRLSDQLRRSATVAELVSLSAQVGSEHGSVGVQTMMASARLVEFGIDPSSTAAAQSALVEMVGLGTYEDLAGDCLDGTTLFRACIATKPATRAAASQFLNAVITALPAERNLKELAYFLGAIDSAARRGGDDVHEAIMHVQTTVVMPRILAGLQGEHDHAKRLYRYLVTAWVSARRIDLLVATMREAMDSALNDDVEESLFGTPLWDLRQAHKSQPFSAEEIAGLSALAVEFTARAPISAGLVYSVIECSDILPREVTHQLVRHVLDRHDPADSGGVAFRLSERSAEIYVQPLHAAYRAAQQAGDTIRIAAIADVAGRLRVELPVQ